MKTVYVGSAMSKAGDPVDGGTGGRDEREETRSKEDALQETAMTGGAMKVRGAGSWTYR